MALEARCKVVSGRKFAFKSQKSPQKGKNCNRIIRPNSFKKNTRLMWYGVLYEYAVWNIPVFGFYGVLNVLHLSLAAQLITCVHVWQDQFMWLCYFFLFFRGCPNCTQCPDVWRLLGVRETLLQRVDLQESRAMGGVLETFSTTGCSGEIDNSLFPLACYLCLRPPFAADIMLLSLL
jgi:hypothetical protein